MPPVTLLSPYSGRPVVVREQDLGRAVRDEAGRVFYVVEDGDLGHYAAKTRKGSPKDLEHYRALQSGEIPADEPLADPAAVAPGLGSAPAHDATGTTRRNPVGIIVLAIAALIIGAAAYLLITQFGLGGDSTGTDQPTAPDADPQGQDQGGATPARKPSIVVPVVFMDVSNEDIDEYGTDDIPSEADDEQPADPPAEDTAQHNTDADEQPDPKVSDSPAALPENERVADPVIPDEDPTPVIVPTKTWQPEPAPAPKESRPQPKPYAGFNHKASGLRYKLTHKTDGPPARAGSYLEVRYTAQTLEGDSLIDDGSQSFVLMSGQAIRAFDEGLAGVREGEQLRLFVPRGHSTSGVLPGIKRLPDAPFMLDVQLVSVRPGVTHVVEAKGNPDLDPALPGDTIRIDYVARVEGKNQIVDSTAQHGKPLRLTLGQRRVIPGLELGLIGMRVGETRLITIPPYLAYGKQDVADGLIPPDSVLSFRVTLVGIDPPPEPAPPANPEANASATADRR